MKLLGFVGTSGSGEEVDMDDVIQQQICSKSIIPLDAEVEVVLMLDCCYSYLSTRSPNVSHRRVDRYPVRWADCDPFYHPFFVLNDNTTFDFP